MRLRTVLALAFALAATSASAQDDASRSASPLAGQEALLRDSAAQLLFHRPGVADVYVIAVAGSAGEEVFRREAASARALFDERFDAAGRSVLLANSLTSAASVPLATPENLRRMIEEVAARIDPDEDMVVLFLTSHGKPGRFSLRYPGVVLEPLTPKALDGMLRDAGVAWRTVIVSACHSGSFIPALRDERTLVLAAAAADRSSFGCKDENDFTYFGRALIDEELRRSRSFLDAFDAAKRSIGAREAALGLPPSEPQAFVGAAVRAKLDEIERRLIRAAGAGS